jgi:hypothetical protein
MKRRKVKKHETKPRPVAVIAVGKITANIWQTVNDRGTFHSITFERRYRDKKGKWQIARSFKAGTDVRALMEAAARANDKIVNVVMGGESWE